MEPFDQRGALNEALGNFPSQDIPAELNWEAMGPKIQIALENKKKKRRFFWWIPLTLALIGILFYWGTYSFEQSIGHFPVPLRQNLPTVNYSSAIPLASSPVSPDLDQKKKQQKEEPFASPSIESSTLSREVVKNTNRPSAGPELTKDWPNILQPAQMKSLEDGGRPTTSRDDNKIGAKQALPVELAYGTAFAESKATLPLKTRDFLFYSTSNLEGNLAFVTALALSEQSTGNPGLPEQNQLPDNPWQILISAGPVIHRSTVSAASDHFPNRNSEALTGITGSLLLEKSLGNKPYTLSGGLSWMELPEREHYEDELAVQIFQPNTPDTIFRNSFSGAETILYTDTVAGIRQLEIRQHHYLRTLTIPLMLGRQWGNGKWPVGLRAGVAFNWSRWKVGQTISNDYQLVATNTQRSFSTSLRVDGQLYGPSTSWGRPFLSLSYQRFWQKVPGTLAGTHIRPESVSITLGMQFGG